MIHFGRFRMKNQIGTCRFAQCCISVHIPWITFQILAWSKLHWIDKYADNHAVIVCHSTVNQTFMPLMEISHGWHQPNRQALFSPFFYLLSYLCYCIYYFHFVLLPFTLSYHRLNFPKHLIICPIFWTVLYTGHHLINTTCPIRRHLS